MNIKARFENIDFIKGIMIFLMVCYHLNVGHLSNYTSFVYAFHMPVFLLFSGLFTNVNLPFREWFVKLNRMLVIPYIVFASLYILSLYFIGKLGFNFSNKVEQLDFFKLVYYLLFKPIGAFWYIHTLIICTILTYAINRIYFLDDFGRLIIIGIIFYIIDNYSSVNLKFENGLFFLIGQFMRVYKHIIPPSIYSFFGVVILFFFGDYTRGGVSSLGLCFFMISFLFSFHNLYFNNRKNFFTFIGRNTLPVVLLHPIFLNLFKPLQAFFSKVDSSLVLYSIISSFATIVMCMVIAFAFDKVKLSFLLFGKEEIFVRYE